MNKQLDESITELRFQVGRGLRELGNADKMGSLGPMLHTLARRFRVSKKWLAHAAVTSHALPMEQLFTIAMHLDIPVTMHVGDRYGLGENSKRGPIW